MNTQLQQQTVTASELKMRGWTGRLAAFYLKRSTNHVATVLRGERKSESLIKQLASLPVLTAYDREELRRRFRNQRLTATR